MEMIRNNRIDGLQDVTLRVIVWECDNPEWYQTIETVQRDPVTYGHTPKRLATMFSARPACNFKNRSNAFVFAQSSYYERQTNGHITLLCCSQTMYVSTHQYGYKPTKTNEQIGQTDRYTVKTWNVLWMYVQSP